ncbi:hypothetical protein BH09BAC1_BH09BAC1_20060 [soil metagenome]
MYTGELHPFSQFPMYNSFPEWSYVFYIKTHEGRVVSPLLEMKSNSKAVAHVYYSACQKYGVAYGMNLETPLQMKMIADEILSSLVMANPNFQGDTLYFYKKQFYLVNKEIREKETLMTQMYVE